MADRLPVKDMPQILEEACRERGYDPTHEMTFREALCEWAAWEIGHSAWAEIMLAAQDDFKTSLAEQT